MRCLLPALLVSIALSAGCDGNASSGSGGDAGSGGDTGTAGSGGDTGTAGSGGTGGSALCGDDPVLPEETLPDLADPEAGDFTLAEALAGLPEGDGPLRAIIDTDLGTLTCTMHPDEAPIGVANFLGLARGTRAFKDPQTNTWVRRRFYDGLIFHRVIPGFVAQGGDPLGTGFGGPGYKFPNEIAGLTHLAGTLAYANAGADTNGSQFYVCETPKPALDQDYTIFGQCEPTSVVFDITHVPTNQNDKPLTPVHIKSVTVTRCPL